MHVISIASVSNSGKKRPEKTYGVVTELTNKQQLTNI